MLFVLRRMRMGFGWVFFRQCDVDGWNWVDGIGVDAIWANAIWVDGIGWMELGECDSPLRVFAFDDVVYGIYYVLCVYAIFCH